MRLLSGLLCGAFYEVFCVGGGRMCGCIVGADASHNRRKCLLLNALRWYSVTFGDHGYPGGN